jgi:hypothetical protein
VLTAAKLADVQQPSEVIRGRITLPPSLTGLGLGSYEEAAIPAWLGCAYKTGPAVTQLYDGELEGAADLEEARDMMINRLPPDHAELVPTANEFFHLVEGEERTQHLARKLVRKVQEQRLEDLVMRATREEQYNITVARNRTSADVFYAPLTCARYRMPRTFRTTLRWFLGAPVTSPTCSIGGCVNQPVHTNAEHGRQHAQKRIVRRHDNMRDTIQVFLRAHQTSGRTELQCTPERYMEQDLGFTRKQGQGTTAREDARCDLALENPVTHRLDIMDVLVTHPNIRHDEICKTPLAAAEAGAKRKIESYVNDFEIEKETVRPIVFETYGGWAEETFSFLREMTRAIAGADDAIFRKLWRDLRFRLAVNLAKGQAEVVHYINSRERAAVGAARGTPVTTGTTTTTPTTATE